MKISTFANRLRDALSANRMTQTELCEKTGIGKSSITAYLKGEYQAKQDKVDSIARALHVSPAWLMGYDIPERTLGEKLRAIRLNAGFTDAQEFADMMNRFVKNNDLKFKGSKIKFTKHKILQWESDSPRAEDKYLQVYKESFRLSYDDLLDDSIGTVRTTLKKVIYKTDELDDFYVYEDHINDRPCPSAIIDQLSALNDDQIKTIREIIQYMRAYNER